MRNASRLWLKIYAVEHLMSFLVAIMIYTVFAVFVSVLMVQYLFDKWEGSYAGHMIVEVIFDEAPKHPIDRDAMIKSFRKRLDSIQEITSYSFIQSDNVDLTKLAPDFMVEPIFVDVELVPRTLTAMQLRDILAHICPIVQVREPMHKKNVISRYLRFGGAAGAGLAILIIMSCLAVIAFISQASLIINRRVISVMMLMGATPVYVARQFQRHIWRLGGRGAVVGIFAVIVTVLIFYFFCQQYHFDVMGIMHPFLFFFLLFGIPFVIITLMVLSVDVIVRRSVKASLGLENWDV